MLGVRQYQEWFTRFWSWYYGLRDEPKYGRATLSDDVLKTLFESNPHQTIQVIAHELGCRRSTVQENLIAIGKCCRDWKWVPHELTKANLICNSWKGTVSSKSNYRWKIGFVWKPCLQEIVLISWRRYYGPLNLNFNRKGHCSAFSGMK